MDHDAGDPLQHWHPVLARRELGRRPVECRLFEREIVLYRAEDGRPHALDNRCPHRRMRLALGRVAGDRIVCPYHGWSFGPDGSGTSPATPKLRVRTGCYDVAEHRGMVWLRAGGGTGPLPELRYDGYRPIASLQHRLAAPLALLLDNMTELEHSALVHAVFGFELERLHEVKTEARAVAQGIDIDYEGPQRELPFHLRWATGIARGDRFVQRAQVRGGPLRANYDLEWFAGDTGLRRPLALKFVIHFDEAGPRAATQTTFVFARADSRRVRLALGGFGFVLRHHIDRELRADIALVESLQLEPDAAATGLMDRFDRPLMLRRRAEGDAGRAAAGATAALGAAATAAVCATAIPAAVTAAVTTAATATTATTDTTATAATAATAALAPAAEWRPVKLRSFGH